MPSTKAQGISPEASLVVQSRRHLSDRAIQNLFIWPTLLLLIAVNLFPLLYSLYLSFTELSRRFRKAARMGRVRELRQHPERSRHVALFRYDGALRADVRGAADPDRIRHGDAGPVKFFGSGLITTLILVPMMISPVVVGLFWKLIYNPNFGFFNFILGAGDAAKGVDLLASKFFGHSQPGLALFAVVIVDVLDVEPLRDAPRPFRAERNTRIPL